MNLLAPELLAEAWVFITAEGRAYVYTPPESREHLAGICRALIFAAHDIARQHGITLQ